MKQQIRKSVFETNSSSSHSLTLSKGDLAPRPFSAEQLRQGVVEVGLGEYGWEWCRYYRAENKLAYLVTQLVGTRTPSGCPQDVTRLLCEDDPRVQMLCDAVREHTGCTLLIRESSGCIDHQSASGEAGVGLELFNNVQTLRRFVFDPASCVQTGNDNMSAPWDIDTDRGMERVYEAHITDVPADYVPVKLQPVSRMRHELFGTSFGGLLSAAADAELFGAVVSQGIVTAVTWRSEGYSDLYANSNHRGEMASDVTGDRSNRPGFRVSAQFKVDYKYVHGDNMADTLTYVVQLPAEVVERLKALDSKGLRRYQLAQAIQEAKECAKAAAEPKASDWLKKRAASARALVLKLGGLKGLSALDGKPKAAARKSVVKKAAQ